MVRGSHWLGGQAKAGGSDKVIGQVRLSDIISGQIQGLREVVGRVGGPEKVIG